MTREKSKKISAALQKIMILHEGVSQRSPQCETLRAVLNPAKNQTALTTQKALRTINEESLAYGKHLRSRFEVLRKYVAVHQKLHGSTEVKLPSALYEEWRLLKNREHAFVNGNKLAQAQAKITNPELKKLIARHSTMINEIYAEADQVLTSRGLTFAKLEAQEMAA